MALPAFLQQAADRSARPADVAAGLARLLESEPGLAEEWEAEPAFLESAVLVMGASAFLTRQLQRDPPSVAVLRDLDRRPECPADDVARLVAWKRRELLRVAARDLTGRDGLAEVGAGLARLGDDVLTAARRLAGGPAEGVAVVAMGKLGAAELNYSSDVDAIFVGDGDARGVLDVARRCFRVDANLRPEGRNGPLVRTMASFRAYWARWAQPWERQALIKARPVDGPPPLCAEFASEAAEQVWGRPFDADELHQVRAMKSRAEGEVAKRGRAESEVKLGPGGIRDVEFAVQLLQLVHGPGDPTLRAAATLPALAELGRGGYVDADDAGDLAGAYVFLRTVEHRLQLVEEQQTHTVPADRAARQALARVLGFPDDAAAPAVARFDDELRRQRARARAIHERLYFRPLLEALSAAGRNGAMTAGMSPEAVEQRLAAFGFAEAERTRAAVVELTSGLTRSSRLMQSLLPLMLEWLSQSPDPDLGLLGLRLTVDGPRHHRNAVVAAFRESPDTARRLCILLGTSRLLHEPLRRDAGLLARLGAPPRGRAELVRAAGAVTAFRADDDSRQAALRLFKADEEVVVVSSDVTDGADVPRVASSLTALSEALLEAALGTVAEGPPMAVIGMGRFGGAELSYASDLDVLLVHAGTSAAEAAAAESAATRLLRFMNGETPARRIAVLDADLRPEGRQGPLARSLDGYAAYYRRWARTWERQALVRARPVAGDPEVARRFMELVRATVWEPPFTADEEREVRRMKARVERERVPAGEDRDFHLKLGRGSLADVEWTAQLLQLRHHLPSPSTIAALELLRSEGHLSVADADTLSQAYRFCERVRNRLYLVRGAAGDSLPSTPDLAAKLARSLDTTPSQLRDDYRRVTRRCRRVVERLLFGLR